MTIIVETYVSNSFSTSCSEIAPGALLIGRMPGPFSHGKELTATTQTDSILRNDALRRLADYGPPEADVRLRTTGLERKKENGCCKKVDGTR